MLARLDGARAEEFLSIVRPLPPAERALVAMGVAALSTHALTRRGRLIKSPLASDCGRGTLRCRPAR